VSLNSPGESTSSEVLFVQTYSFPSLTFYVLYCEKNFAFLTRNNRFLTIFASIIEMEFRADEIAAEFGDLDLVVGIFRRLVENPVIGGFV